jgi:hypothetical protein
MVVHGLRELQSSLRRAEGDADKQLKRGLRDIGNVVLADARAFAPIGPRPRRSNTRPLAGSLRVAVNAKGVSVYSMQAHAYVQNSGGKVGRHGQVIKRASASGYMTRAVSQNQAKLNRELEQLLDRIESMIHT